METPEENTPSGAGRRPPIRELVVAAALALVVFALPLRDGLFARDSVVFGVDTATTAAPWSERITAPEGVSLPRNPALADQGQVFYPFYLWVARSWLTGDPPAWNPLIYAGAPGIGNPQSGALDPQVAPLVAAYAVGGRPAFDWMLGVVAWLRLAAAGLGAYVLARLLGLGRASGAFAGVAFGLSGYVVLWLNHSLGHVTPLLPWVLVCLEGLRGPRPGRAACGASAAMAAAILGGHPETAFFVGFAAGLWALALFAQDRRAGAVGLAALGVGTLCAAVSLLPFLEYLDLSGAKVIRDAFLAPSGLRFSALGAVLVAAALAAWFARIAEPAPASAEPPTEARHRVIAAVGFALAIGGMVLLLAGISPSAGLVLLPDRYGAPGYGGYQGEGNYLEAASAWVPLAALALALAAALAPAGPLRRRRLVIGLGLVALLLAVEAPGVLDLYRYVPLVGLGATERFAAVSALMLALLGAEALERAPRTSRLAAALTLLVLGAGALRPSSAAPAADAVELPREELFGMLLTPPRELTQDNLELEGWVHPALPITRASLSVQRLDAQGRPDPTACFTAPLDLFDAPSERARAAGEAAGVLAEVPAGARYFRPSYVAFSWLTEGEWRFAVDLFTAESGEQSAGTRIVAVSSVERASGVRVLTIVLGALSLLVVVLLPTRPGAGWKVALVGLALAQGLRFAHGINPAVPRAECFPDTDTEAVLADVLGPHRFFGDPRVLPPSTGLVQGLAGLDGYDGMDVAAYNSYRLLCLPPGTNALLGWHARGVDLASPAFRLLGVGALAMTAPLEADGWELVAGPAGAQGVDRAAECFVYRARDPLPRAFCVPQVVTFDELEPLFTAGLWDPRAVAALDAAWRPAAPFTQAAVSTPVWTNNTVAFDAELDGDGLCVLTDQAFPGWRVYVDGEERELLTANGIFRAVALDAGRHRVEFRYAPNSLKLGLALSIVGLLGAGALLFVGRLLPPTTPRS